MLRTWYFLLSLPLLLLPPYHYLSLSSLLFLILSVFFFPVSFLSLCLSVTLSVSVCLFLCLSVFQSVCHSVGLSVSHCLPLSSSVPQVQVFTGARYPARVGPCVSVGCQTQWRRPVLTGRGQLCTFPLAAHTRSSTGTQLPLCRIVCRHDAGRGIWFVKNVNHLYYMRRGSF